MLIMFLLMYYKIKYLNDIKDLMIISMMILIKELNYMAIEGLENVINEYNLSGRKLTGLLTILEETFNNCKITLSTSNKFDDEEFNLLLNAYSTIVIETIQELKLAIYSEGKKFNIKRFFPKY